jgi:hypothetical protein
MREKNISETISDVAEEMEGGGFAYSDVLMELRAMVTEVITDYTDIYPPTLDHK